MKIEIIVSTMNLNNLDLLLEGMNLNGKDVFITVINQSKDNLLSEEVINVNKNIKLINTNSIGTSNSRNLGIKYMNKLSDIICFTDDDVTYDNDFDTDIKKAMQENKDIDALVFNIRCEDEKRDIKEIKKSHRICIFNLFRYGMYNFAIRKNIILKNKMKFSDKFGGNSKYILGEDSLFIYNMYKNKAKMYAVTLTLGSVSHNESTWHHEEFSRNYFITKGALFYACDKNIYFLFFIYFALKHKKKSGKSYIYILKAMNEGKNKYKTEDYI